MDKAKSKLYQSNRQAYHLFEESFPSRVAVAAAAVNTSFSRKEDTVLNRNPTASIVLEESATDRVVSYANYIGGPNQSHNFSTDKLNNKNRQSRQSYKAIRSSN